MEKVRGNKILKVVWDYLIMTIGTLIYCMSWESFMIPNDIASGGLTGACTIIQFATGIPVSYTFILINILLLIGGSLILGKGFGLRTIYVIGLSTVLFRIIPTMPFLQAIPTMPLYISDKVLVAIIGGLLEAVGIHIIFSKGGSTGGTDIVALVINKFWPISLGTVFIYVDLFIIATILLVPGRNFQDMIYGYIAMVTFSLMLDYLQLGRKSSLQVMVFSKKYKEIADYIITVMDRGVTALNSVGWYTKENKEVLLIIIRRSQIKELTRAIKSVDNDAFVSVCPARSVFGEGFEEMKTGISRNNKESKTSPLKANAGRTDTNVS